MKTPSQIYEQSQRISRKFWKRFERRAKVAHPETGGSRHLIGNWGNEAARAIWAEHDRAYEPIKAAADRLYTEADHRRHDAAGWVISNCPLCPKPVKRVRGRSKKVGAS